MTFSAFQLFIHLFTFAWACYFELFSGLLFVGWIDGSEISHFSSEFFILFGNHPFLVRSSGSIWFDFNKPRPAWSSPANQRRVRETCVSWIFSALNRWIVSFFSKKGKAKWEERHLAVKCFFQKMAPEALAVVKQINTLESFHEIIDADMKFKPQLLNKTNLMGIFQWRVGAPNPSAQRGGSVSVHKTGRGQLSNEFNEIVECKTKTLCVMISGWANRQLQLDKTSRN